MSYKKVSYKQRIKYHCKDDNQVWVDVWKFYMAIHSDTCENGFYTADYIKEKLMQIMKGETNWHALVNKAYEDQKPSILCCEKCKNEWESCVCR